MKNLTFVGDFNVVVTNETQFLSDCSIALDPVRCIYVYSGSIIVTLTGEANIVEETITRIYDQGLIMGGYDTLFTIDSDTTSGEMQVNAAGAGGGSFSTSIIVVILIVLLLIGVACYAAWPYRDKIMGRLGLGESSDFSENQSEGAKKKVEYKKAKKIEIYEVKPQETSIVEALDHGLEQIKMAAESNCDINERSENDQSTAAILTVIRRQDPEILEFLAKNNADLDAKNVMGLAACHYAARDGLDMHLQLLIDYKANLQLKNIAGFTPLQIAQQNRRGEIVDMLQDHVVEIICDEDYSSPLTIAQSPLGDGFDEVYQFPVKCQTPLGDGFDEPQDLLNLVENVKYPRMASTPGLQFSQRAFLEADPPPSTSLKNEKVCRERIVSISKPQIPTEI